MTKLHSKVAVSAAMACLVASPAVAQVRDHLKCYKIKDTASFSATVNLAPEPASPFLPDAGCTVKVHSRQLCVPVEKDLVSSGGPELAVSGQALDNAFLCYAVKCPAALVPDSLQMSDQFGTRTLTGMRTSTICAPAITGVPPTTTTLPPPPPRSCVDATPPNCDGTCNDYNFACGVEAGACACIYVDVFQGCPMVGHDVPECWGACEGTQTCIEVSGACVCGFAY